LTRPPILRISPHVSFIYSKTHGESHHELKHTRSQGVGRQGSCMDTLLKSGRDLTPINMKSVIGVRSFPLLRVDKKQSGNFGSVNGGTS